VQCASLTWASLGPELGLQSCAGRASGACGWRSHKLMVSRRQMTPYEVWGSVWALACFL